jgi:hypothetical protein
MYPLIRENLRTAEAIVHAERGREAEARRDFEQLAAGGFSGVARNMAWLFSIAWLAEVCAWLGDAARAETLYGLLAPFATRQVTIGPILAFGAVARYLGVLAAT